MLSFRTEFIGKKQTKLELRVVMCPWVLCEQLNIHHSTLQAGEYNPIMSSQHNGQLHRE